MKRLFLMNILVVGAAIAVAGGQAHSHAASVPGPGAEVSPLFQAETPHLLVSFLGQSAALPTWAAMVAAPPQQGADAPTSVKQNDKDPNNCSVKQDNGECSVSGGKKSTQSCSVFKGKEGVCSTQEFNNGRCSVFGPKTFCSVFGGAEDGVCSVTSNKNGGNQCSVFDQGGVGAHECSAQAAKGKNAFCSVKDGGGRGGSSFCSVQRGQSSKYQCSAWADNPGNTCSVNAPGPGSFCSVIKGGGGQCSVQGSQNDTKQCSSHNSGGETRCSVYDPANRKADPPSKKGKCNGS